MVCLDTSSLIAYLGGVSGRDVDLVDQALTDEVAVVSPITVTELLSDPHLTAELQAIILTLPTLSIQEGFWQRAGWLRAKVLKAGLKAKLADSLIAQSCLDHRATLITRDRDFRTFQRVGGLGVVGVTQEHKGDT
jgi:hypothetical protein